MKEASVRIDPPFWWVGMNNSILQLFVFGTGIANYIPEISSRTVKFERFIRFHSDNYLALYLNISQASAGNFTVSFTSGRRSIMVQYELRKRSPREGQNGFGSSDVIYLLMPDRFSRDNPATTPAPTKYSYKWDRSDPNAWHGGDIRGIRKHLQYLSDLGITAVWPTPLLENDQPEGGYHGYSVTDFYQVDKRFGTNEEYQDLVHTAHSLKLKWIMDLIFNHCSSSHPWYLDPPTKDWFHWYDNYRQTNYDVICQYNPYVSDFDHAEMEFGAFVKTMPDLNQSQPDLMKYLTQVSFFWIEFLQLDGIRMDTWPYCEQDAMSQWVRDVRSEFPDFNIVGECWSGQSAGCAFFQAGNLFNPKQPELPSVMDFPFQSGARGFVNVNTNTDNGLGALYHHLALDLCYPNVFRLMRFLDNHDTDRFLEDLPQDLSHWKQAVAILLTVPGIPQIYYGTEILMYGNKGGSDGNVRRDFPGGWKGDSHDAFTPEGRTPLQNEAWNFLRNLLHWRQGNVMASEGRMKVFRPQKGAFVYERKHNDKHFLVFLNGMDNPIKIDVARYSEVIGGCKKWVDICYGEKVELEGQLELAGRVVLILEEESNVSPEKLRFVPEKPPRRRRIVRGRRSSYSGFVAGDRT
jgi:glycosidase